MTKFTQSDFNNADRYLKTHSKEIAKKTKDIIVSELNLKKKNK